MKILIFILAIAFSIAGFGQELVIPDYRGDKESFKNLKNKTHVKNWRHLPLKGVMKIIQP